MRSSAGGLDWTAFAKISEDLRAAFPGVEIDLVDLRRADPLLLRQIFLAARPLYEEPRRFGEARLHAFHRYEDYRPFLQLERRAVRRALGLDAG